MQKWIKPVEADEIVDGKVYFVARVPESRLAPWMFYSDRNVKAEWVMKPGIATQFIGAEPLREKLRGTAGICVAVEVPADASKRWRARK
jgi:hypothetical protein